MKILNFGSLNIDNVYNVEEFVRPGETVTAKSHTVFAGGKGLNQSIAAARAGAEVIHGGAIGSDGGFLASLLEEAGADAGHLLRLDIPTGHTVIEVDAGGQNRILVWGGANRGLTHAYLEDVFACGSDGDIAPASERDQPHRQHHPPCARSRLPRSIQPLTLPGESRCAAA